MATSVACSAVSAAHHVVNNDHPVPPNPYNQATQQKIRDGIDTLMPLILGTSAYKNALAPTVVPGVGNLAYCDTSVSQTASDETAPQQSGSLLVDLDTPVDSNNNCPTPSASNIIRLTVGIELADGSRRTLDMSNSFPDATKGYTLIANTGTNNNTTGSGFARPQDVTPDLSYAHEIVSELGDSHPAITTTIAGGMYYATQSLLPIS